MADFTDNEKKFLHLLMENRIALFGLIDGAVERAEQLDDLQKELDDLRNDKA